MFLYEAKSDELYIETGTSKKGRFLQCVPHVHPHIELVYMKDGRSDGYVDLKRYEIEKDDLFVSFSNQVHYYRGNENQSFILMIVSPDFIPEFKTKYAGIIPTSALIKNISELKTLKSIINLIDSEYVGNKLKNPDVYKGLFYALISEIFKNLGFVEQTGLENNSSREIIRYCSDNYKNEISLSSLSEELHLNKYYISHVFSNKLHISLSDYVAFLRSTEASRLLIRTDKPITEISEEVGFNTVRSFNRSFQKQFSTTPGEYRKKFARNKEQKTQKEQI